jgi:hypothetical protein
MSTPQAVQVTLASTGVAQQLPNIPLKNQYNSATLAAGAGNAAAITVGNTAALATTGGGGGVMAAGGLVAIGLSNANQLYVSGTSGDKLSIFGSTLE